MNITTSRLYIRELQNSDWQGLKEIAITHQKSPFSNFDHPLPIEDKEIQKVTNFFVDRGLFFAVFLKDSNNMIGYVCFQNKDNYYDIGYCLHSDYQKKGYAYESCSELMNYLTQHSQIKGFTAGAAMNNTPSCKLLYKLGFELIGRKMISFYKDENGNDVYFEGGKFAKNVIYIPQEIKNLIQGKRYAIDEVGMSGSTILMFNDMVLKIQKHSVEVDSEIQIMKWLKEKVPAPQVLFHMFEEDKSYLLMTKIDGKMSCDNDYLENCDVMVDVLVSALKRLWEVDISSCSSDWTLKNKLKEAKMRVENNLVDEDDVDPNTFGENGFKDPQALYDWLVANQPEEDLVLSHGDFCLPNIFIKDNQLAGYIDLGRMGKADRWQDIALCYRSLRDNMNGSYGGKVHKDFDPDILFEKLGIEIDVEKLKYYLLLDELF